MAGNSNFHTQPLCWHLKRLVSELKILDREWNVPVITDFVCLHLKSDRFPHKNFVVLQRCDEGILLLLLPPTKELLRFTVEEK